MRVVHFLFSPHDPWDVKVYFKQRTGVVWVAAHTAEQRYMPLLDAWVEVISMAPGYEGPVLTVRARGDGTYYVWSGTVVCVMCPVAHGGSEGQSSLQNHVRPLAARNRFHIAQ